MELRYIKTSSNCFNKKKQEAMHCRPGMVSTKNIQIHYMGTDIRTAFQNAANMLIMFISRINVSSPLQEHYYKFVRR